MSAHLGPRRVVAPDGTEWRVGRRWLTRRPRWRPPRSRETASEALQNIGSGFPDPGSLDLGEGLLVIVAAVAVVLVLIPVLFFGIELIVLGAVLAAGVIGRTILRQPWVVEARPVDSRNAGRLIEWRVRGWRHSARLIAKVASELAAGEEPSDQAETPH